MNDEELEINFSEFKTEIEQCLLEKDVNYFMEDLEQLFDEADISFINSSGNNLKVKNFISRYNKLQTLKKYSILRNSAKKHNKWIYNFLSIDSLKLERIIDLRSKWNILQRTLTLIKDSFYMSAVEIYALYNKDIISKANRDYLLEVYQKDGSEKALSEVFRVVSTKDPEWHKCLLSIITKQHNSFTNIFCGDDMGNIEKSDNYAREEIFSNDTDGLINTHLKQYDIEKNIEELNIKDCDEKSEYSNMGYEADILDNEIDNDFGILSDEECVTLKIELKAFQLELVETALTGLNDIIYAPTGSGKTNIAVYIANDHLRKNSKGKVAFLVHRIPLVTQQYRVFKKYKDPEFNVVDIRGRSDNLSGPLIAQMEMNNIIIMTSEILYNALTIDDGNMISSISEFSLIFIDECHNCMKSHPYMKIMSRYFKEKFENPNKKVPQIIGLTASPRSNKKDDIKGVKKSLFELCGNMDCYHISIVKRNKNGLEEFLAQPKQTIICPKNREKDEFETALIRQMEFCENKLLKMKNQNYFPSTEIRSIPEDKFKQEYVGFVGNLERLNTVTDNICDGKQKTFAIYRYLNAYYRGLIVNQMFDQDYAKKSIEKNLKHNGIDFTSSYDEEFYNNYKNNIVNCVHEQSDNPSLNSIVSQIFEQLDTSEDSRILVFVREKMFTHYLVNILTEIYGIASEAIIGSNAKSDYTSCTVNEIDNILKRFTSGTTKVLVATTVVEEGLDVALCNMVISYGHVTNETAMVQRKGRVRAINSKYFLILPPMLNWLEKKEHINERRKEMMMRIIDQFENIDPHEMKEAIKNHQIIQYSKQEKKPNLMITANAWSFSCKSCQTHICSSVDLRIIERAHRICIIPEILQTFKVVKEDIISYGTQGIYEYGGKVLCHKCHNYELGGYIYYRKIPFFQLKITSCNGIDSNRRSFSFKKWADFAKYYSIIDLKPDDIEYYSKRLFELM